MQASRHQVQCTTAAVRPPASAPAASKRQRVAAAAAVQRRRQPATACGQRRRGLVLAAAAASGGDAGDDYEELLERRDELLRLQGDELREGLNTDEDEELADLTERLLKFGFLEDGDSEAIDAALAEDDDSDAAGTDEEEEEEGEGAEALYSDEDSTEDDDEGLGEEEGAEGAAAGSAEGGQAPPQRGRGGRGNKIMPDLEIDEIVRQATTAAQETMRNMGQFEATSPGISSPQAPGEAAEEAEAAERRYPEPPPRSYGLGELLRMAGFDEQAAAAPPGLEVSDLLTCNSISASQGGAALYVCVPSADGQHDGHDWADEAADMGAVAVLAARPLPDALLPVVVVPDLQAALGRLAAAFYERPAARMRTVGVVGSFGKTTTAWLARGMFEETNERCGMIGTIEYALAEDRLTEEGAIWAPDEDDITLQRDASSPFHVTPYQGKYPTVPSTPDALHLQKVLAGCADRGASTTVVECDPSTLADGRAAEVDFEVLVYTNTYADGEAAAGGAAAYLAAVAPLFERLRDPERQRAVINLDDKHGAVLAQRTGATVLTYALDNRGADIYAEKVKNSIWETEVLVNTPLGRLQIITPLLGKNAAYNVLAAVATGIACGVPLKAVVAGIEAVDIIPGRCEIVDEGQQFSVVVDSASTPEQLSRLLDDVKDAGAKRVLLVFGCPGTSTAQERGAMAEMAHFKAESVFLTNDSPGVAWPNDIINDMVAGLPDELLNRHAGSVYPFLQDPHRVPQWFQKFMLQYQSQAGVYVVEDRYQAIRVAIGMARAREVVIVAGKGHQDWQEYWDGADFENRETLKSWFDDRVECRNALSKLSYLAGIKDLDRAFLPWTRYPEERDLLVGAGYSDVVPSDY